MHRYARLWNKFGSKGFDFDSALKCLGNDSMISIVLSELRKNGWLEVSLDANDSRKRLYRLKSPEECIKEMALRDGKK